MGRASALIVALLASACDVPAGEAPDAATPGLDGAIDGDLVSFGLTGQYLDWDSTVAAPCPIVGAKWTAHRDDTRVATTDANGVFTIRLASYLGELDIELPVVASTCTSPPSRYEIPAMAIVPPAVHFAGGHFIARALTMARAASFYASFGASFDATRSHLLVHIDGPPRAVSITRAHAGAQAFDGSTWSAGASGVDVYFPNIDLTGDAITTVTVAGGAIGTGSVSLPAGKIVYLTVVVN